MSIKAQFFAICDRLSITSINYKKLLRIFLLCSTIYSTLIKNIICSVYD
jgi:hypothetical protein